MLWAASSPWRNSRTPLTDVRGSVDSARYRAATVRERFHHGLLGSGHWSGVEWRVRVGQPPVIRPGLPACAGDVENEPEDLPADVGDGRVSGCDAAGIDVDEVGPALG